MSYFGMFSDAGTAAVQALVDQSIASHWTWKQTYEKLKEVRRQFPEALDTDVRECVYCAIGAHKRDEEFYL